MNLKVDLAKMAYKDELKKRKRDNIPQKAFEASKATPDKVKKLKKTEGDKCFS